MFSKTEKKRNKHEPVGIGFKTIQNNSEFAVVNIPSRDVPTVTFKDNSAGEEDDEFEGEYTVVGGVKYGVALMVSRARWEQLKG